MVPSSIFTDFFTFSLIIFPFFLSVKKSWSLLSPPPLPSPCGRGDLLLSRAALRRFVLGRRAEDAGLVRTGVQLVRGHEDMRKGVMREFVTEDGRNARMLFPGERKID